MNHVGLANLPFLLLCGTGTKLKLLLNLINPVLKIKLLILLCITWVHWWVLPNFVALVVVFPEIVEFLHFVSRVLFCQVFGVECCGDVDVVRRLGADETRDDPHGRGEGRGAPHEIHDGRLQGLGQVLLVHGVGSSPRPGVGWVGGVYSGAKTLVGIRAGGMPSPPSFLLSSFRSQPAWCSLDSRSMGGSCLCCLFVQ